ncbi:MAG: hypothetical protein HOL66_13585 [Rhodospirillaceae bacterium]|jgi:hypothetical protein|nr:hypothetical protein [Rhodospirillaceae bacterium]MBT5245263.1 hypothetical protein [Rhodospirillaceae bacterium]MBT5563069.1 hypothetical protein [Rhodospirillaceae bacterium]MBT7138111.1 hypothetical protein [Rhodospirillaceae bacterium]
MITRTALMTLIFAVVINCGAAAYALINNGSSLGFQSTSYSSYGYGDNDDDDDDDDDDHHHDDDDDD